MSISICVYVLTVDGIFRTLYANNEIDTSDEHALFWGNCYNNRIIVGTTQIMHVNSLRCYFVVIFDI